jgi:hypothetical protein
VSITLTVTVEFLQVSSEDSKHALTRLGTWISASIQVLYMNADVIQ